MPDYSTFSAEDFAFDPSFQAWVNAPESADDTFWPDWVLTHPEQAADVQLARQVVLGLNAGQPDVDQRQIDGDVDRMVQRIRRQSGSPLFTVSRSAGYRYWAAAAAAVLLVVGIGWTVNRLNSDGAAPTEIGAQFIDNKPVYANQTDKPALLTLPDGSTVTLSPNSTLRHERTFGKSTRDVVLTGEAFFSVVRNENVPFRVFTDDIVTKVLGTSFRVSAYATARRMTVTVRTGKVSVYARTETGDPANISGKDRREQVISLTPNQAVYYSKLTRKFHKTLTNNPVPIGETPAADAFVFDETPISEVFQRLETTYGIPIDYDRKRLRDCALTASLANENLTEKLTAICKGIEGRYEIVDGRVVIQSAGCQ